MGSLPAVLLRFSVKLKIARGRRMLMNSLPLLPQLPSLSLSEQVNIVRANHLPVFDAVSDSPKPRSYLRLWHDKHFIQQQLFFVWRRRRAGKWSPDSLLDKQHHNVLWTLQRRVLMHSARDLCYFIWSCKNSVNLNLIAVCHGEAHWACVGEQLLTMHTAAGPVLREAHLEPQHQTTCCLSQPSVLTSHRFFNTEWKAVFFFLLFSFSPLLFRFLAMKKLLGSWDWAQLLSSLILASW